jgi:hypothetical protein
MNPEQIRYNSKLDYYHINIGVEGTDDRFLEGVGEIGSKDAVDQKVNTDALPTMASNIHDSQIDGGHVDLMNMMQDSHFQLQIQ